MNSVQKTYQGHQKCRVSVQRRFLFSAAVLFRIPRLIRRVLLTWMHRSIMAEPITGGPTSLPTSLITL